MREEAFGFENAARIARRVATLFIAVALQVLALPSCRPPSRPSIDEDRIIDLGYAFGNETVYWPTASRFKLEQVAHGYDESGRWYAANEFTAAEHGGTHLDAPIHFAQDGWTADEIPLDRLMGPARVIDITDRVGPDRDYRLAPVDIARHESEHGRITPGTVVIVRTGFASRYPSLDAYLGSAERGTAAGLSFPGIGADAARVLVERGIDMVGLDTASLDYGPSKDFAAHRIFAGANVPGLENLTNLDRLPATGAYIIAMPMKIAGGTGGPCRVIAILP